MRYFFRIFIQSVMGFLFLVFPQFLLAGASLDGALDIFFNNTGKVLSNFTGSTSYDVAYSTVLQSDGKIVVVGSSLQSSGTQFALARYNEDGSLDTSFNGTGQVLSGFPGSTGYDVAYSTVLQSDGKIVVVGSSLQSSGTQFALARYNEDGSLDTSFNGTGQVLSGFPGSTGYDVAYSTVLQSDGKIVAVGFSHQSAGYQFALARYNEDGSLDTSFNGTGQVLTVFPGYLGDDIGYSTALQSDGKIVAAGFSFQNAGAQFALARYNEDGSLDTSFNGTGQVLTAFPASLGDDEVTSVAFQNGGKIVAAGYSHQSAGYQFAIARYLGVSSDLALSVSASESIINQGSNVTFTLTLTNNGPDASGLSNLIYTIPNGLSLVNFSTSMGSCSGATTVICELGVLNKGSSATITIVVTANSIGSITNIFTANSENNLVDFDTTHDTASITLTVNSGSSGTSSPLGASGISNLTGSGACSLGSNSSKESLLFLFASSVLFLILWRKLRLG